MNYKGRNRKEVIDKMYGEFIITIINKEVISYKGWEGQQKIDKVSSTEADLGTRDKKLLWGLSIINSTPNIVLIDILFFKSWIRTWSSTGQFEIMKSNQKIVDLYLFKKCLILSINNKKEKKNLIRYICRQTFFTRFYYIFFLLHYLTFNMISYNE